MVLTTHSHFMVFGPINVLVLMLLAEVATVTELPVQLLLSSSPRIAHSIIVC